MASRHILGEKYKRKRKKRFPKTMSLLLATLIPGVLSSRSRAVVPRQLDLQLTLIVSTLETARMFSSARVRPGSLINLESLDGGFWDIAHGCSSVSRLSRCWHSSACRIFLGARCARWCARCNAAADAAYMEYAKRSAC